jgi:L-fucose isomerase-like protein
MSSRKDKAMSMKSNITGINANALRVAWAAHRGAGETTGAEAGIIMQRLLPPGAFTMVDSQPDIILFMSGGSERRAIELADPERPVLLLSIRGNNAYAAATEVMAWMGNHNRIAVLSDATDASESGLIERWRSAAGAWQNLEGKRAGLIGTVSEWLVASDVSAGILLRQFGVNLVGLPWTQLPDFSNEEPDSALLSRFGGQKAAGLDEAARILTLIRRVISDNNLNAVGVECFSLVQKRKVTACLALAQLNAEGTVAACEGDLASMAGMMAGQAATGIVPWMANTTRLTEKTLILSHCTISFDLVSDIKLPTHFETDNSLAIDGQMTAKEVTIFRFSEKLDRVFIAEGRVAGRPRLPDACRTQLEIELTENKLKTLRETPLGNHLLVLPGRHAGLIELACRYRGIREVE